MLSEADKAAQVPYQENMWYANVIRLTLDGI